MISTAAIPSAGDAPAFVGNQPVDGPRNYCIDNQFVPVPLLESGIEQAKFGLIRPCAVPIDVREHFSCEAMSKLEGRLSNPNTRRVVIQVDVFVPTSPDTEQTDTVRLAERPQRAFNYDRPSKRNGNMELRVAGEKCRYLLI